MSDDYGLDAKDIGWGYCSEHDCDVRKCPSDCRSRREYVYALYRDPVEMDVPLGELLTVTAQRAVDLVNETGRTVHCIFTGYNTWAFPGDTVEDVISRRHGKERRPEFR